MGLLHVPAAEGQAATAITAKAGRAKVKGLDFEDFFENGGIALHLLDADGTILHANRAELELLGYRPEEYIGHAIAEFHADKDAIDDILARLARGENLRRYPAGVRARDGSIKQVEITSNARFRDGQLINTRCFTVDVTGLKPPAANVRHNDSQLHQMLEALPAAVYATDRAGKITYYNRAAAELAGREPELGEDESCVTFRVFAPDGSEMPHEQYPMAVALKEDRPVRGVEAVAQRPDGTFFPFLPFPTPLHDENGELVGAVNILVDISERKEAEAHQRSLLDELNHRVKNNMQMLHGLLRSAQRDTKSVEAQAVLADASQRVAAMAAAQRLLYSDNNPSSFGMSEFAHAVCDAARQPFGRNVKIRIEAEGGFLSNHMSMPLALILNELVTNAAKHGIDGRGTGEISVTLTRAEGQVVLTVADDGPGFELHETGRRSSGLGLVSGLSRQLRGTFTVERADGTRCVVKIPETREP
jgi:PAS domain S-box-containing protein